MADNYIPGDWNTRPLEEKLQAENERLREALEYIKTLQNKNVCADPNYPTWEIESLVNEALERG